MAELKDKELNEVNGGSLSDWAEKKKEQIEKWEKNSHNPVTPISDPLLPGVDIPDDLLDKIVAGREDIEFDEQKMLERGGKNYAKDILDPVEPGSSNNLQSSGGTHNHWPMSS